MRKLTDTEHAASENAFEMSTESLALAMACEHVMEAREMCGNLSLAFAKAAAVYGPDNEHMPWFREVNLMLAQIYQSLLDEFQPDIDELKRINAFAESVAPDTADLSEIVEKLAEMGYQGVPVPMPQEELQRLIRSSEYGKKKRTTQD